MRRKLLITLIATVLVSISLVAGNLIAGNKPSLGLDLQGGASVTLEPKGDYDTVALDVAVEIIRSRVDSIGVAEPEIIRQGSTVVINLPGVKDQQRALEIVGRTGEVLLRPVLQSGMRNDDATTTTIAGQTTVPGATSSTIAGATTTVAGATTTVAGATTTVAGATTTVAGATTTVAGATTSQPASSGGLGKTRQPMSAATTTTPTTTPTTVAPSTSVGSTDVGVTTTTVAVAPSTPQQDISMTNEPSKQAILEGRDGLVYFTGPSQADGQVFANDAAAQINSGSWVVAVGLRGGASGEDKWNLLAAQCFQKAATCPTGQIAIVLDGVVISAPVVQTANFSGSVQISGDFKEAEAKDLAKILEFGAVPVRFDSPTAQTVSATLGKDSLNAALISGLVGVLLVLLFLFFYYRRLAIVVLGGLAISGMLQWSAISWLSQRNGLALSLSGVTGIIVSVGVTVDSYVVFFEKLKDDVLGGKTLKNSATRSFNSAWRTIIAADTVSLIGAVVLWFLTVGSVRGFAFFLGLSTLCDIIVAYFFTRPTVILMSRSKWMNGAKMFGVRARRTDDGNDQLVESSTEGVVAR
ncbi:MAG: protein translocase subunit SecD [Actinobacteria bacterium]|nr:protein translocase subunit SecD [Actinomycetota bacterium]